MPEWNVVLWVGGLLLAFFAILILAEAIYWRSLKKKQQKQDAQKSPDPSTEQRGENER